METVENEIPSGVPCTSYKVQVLTFEEIKKIADNGWAIIKNPVREQGILVRGELVFHSYDYEAALDAMATSGARHVAIKYCGKRDPNVVYIF